MANDYFNHVNNRLEDGTRATDTQINNIADEIALGFDKIPDESEIRGETVNLATNTGSGNAIVASLSYTPSLEDGFRVRIRTAEGNSGATTMNLNSLGVKNVVNSDGSALTPAAIAGNTINDFYWDAVGDRWVLSSNNSAWGKPDGVAAPPSSEFCPGYTYTFVDTDTWRVENIDVSNLFSVGRRLKFVDGENTYYGTINNVAFATHTDMDMTMEGGDVLTNTITEVCLVTNAVSWSPIATDPFAGSSINDICTGVIGLTEWWFAVGDGGKVATSSNGGLTWTLRSTGTSENLNGCVYDSDNETFWAGGDAGVLVSSTNGTSMVLDTTSIPALTGSDNYNIFGIEYSEINTALYLIYKDESDGDSRSASSTDQGTTWITRAIFSAPVQKRNVHAVWNSSTQRSNQFHVYRINNVGLRFVSSETTFSTTVGDNLGAGNIPTSAGFFHDGTLSVRLYGCTTGNVIAGSQWLGDDTTTFSYQINDFAWSPTHERLVCVGNNSQIGYVGIADKDNNNAWTQAGNGFNPLANIQAVAWNENDGVFVAVADNGQICRSSNGVN